MSLRRCNNTKYLSKNQSSFKINNKKALWIDNDFYSLVLFLMTNDYFDFIILKKIVFEFRSYLNRIVI